MASRMKCTFKIQNRLLNGVYRNSRHFNQTCSAAYCTREKVDPKKKKYTNTINLPQTDFPLRLDAEKRIERDKAINKNCKFASLYEWQRENVKGPEFILHDGPPYANGKPHMGHAINKILKDIITRQKLLEGHRIHYMPGWDCHGLPIELKALGGQTNLSPVEIHRKAEKFAKEAIAVQREAFESWGVMADWEKCYFTFDKKYVKNQLQQFWKLYEKGLVFRDIKPVFWSPSSRTALAEAELEYNPAHRSTAVTVRIRLEKLPEAITCSNKATVYALVWTTTPWTLPVNQAVCFNPDLTYSLISIDGHNGELYIVASELVDSLKQKLGQTVDVVSSFSGNSLRSASYVHPLKGDKTQPFLPAEHVTTSKGTGLVHSAPAHGPEDFLVALQHSIPIECLVDEDGCYTEGAGASLQGLPVLSQGNEAVLKLMANSIIHSEEFVHSYPYDWRTKQPVILRASRQWFIDTDSIKYKAMEALKEVDIFPEYGSSSRTGGGLMTQLERRPYWCISRQRVWGVPIPVLYIKSSGKPLISRSLVDNLCRLLDEHGTDFWWTLPIDKVITKDLLEEHGVTLDEIERGQDILDIWFDSGMSWSCVLGEDKVADLYLEGVDQFTGWFQSSLMTSVALRNIPPYRGIFVHGFAVDGEGRKMSKSVGNVVNPIDITHGGKNKKIDPAYGIDTLRWWVACHATQHANIPVSKSVIKSSAEAVHKIRIVLRFLLGALHDYSEDGNENLYLLDRYLLHLLLEFHNQVKEAYERYHFNKVCILLNNFVTNEVSALYCHLVKDRLYCEPADAAHRRGCQLVMSHILETVIRAMAPMLPHLAEEVYLHNISKQGVQLFRSGIITPELEWHQPEVAKVVNLGLEVKRTLNKMSAHTNTQQLSASIFSSGETYSLLTLLQLEEQSCWSQIAEILQVSSVRLVKSESPLKFHLEVAETTQHSLCPRCRRHTSDRSDEPCIRCQNVLAQLAGTL